ncbi:MAG: hypothetical protein V4650_00585 [Pseudomonadota bacterium]
MNKTNRLQDAWRKRPSCKQAAQESSFLSVLCGVESRTQAASMSSSSKRTPQ